jgi:hypothetical protein
MQLWKKTTIALLVSIITYPVVGMERKKHYTQTTSTTTTPTTSRTTTSLSAFQKSTEKDHVLSLFDQLIDAETKQEIDGIVEEIMKILQITWEDQIQEHLNHWRSSEQKAYAERAYEKGYDYNRLYQYKEGYDENNKISPNRALGKHESSTLETEIRPWETLLRELHSLIG